MKLVRVSDCCGVRLCSIEFNYVRLLDRSITERSIAFDWQNFFASSIKFDYRTQSSDWVRLATPGLLVAWLLLWEGNKRVFFPPFFLWKEKFRHNFRRVSEKSMWDWALTLGEAVCQRSVRQENTMARDGTLPSYLYHKEVLPWDSISLEPAEPSASEANERDEAGDEDEEEGVLEYDFSDSVDDSEE